MISYSAIVLFVALDFRLSKNISMATLVLSAMELKSGVSEVSLGMLPTEYVHAKSTVNDLRSESVNGSPSDTSMLE